MISLYEKDASSFSNNGLLVLNPTSCVVHEVAGGEYELTIEHPMDDNKKFMMITEQRIIKAPVPKTVIPAITLPELRVLTTTEATSLYSKTPTTRYTSQYHAIIALIAANPSAYAWNPDRLYNAGSYVSYGYNAYRAKRGSIGSRPNEDYYIWDNLGDYRNPTVVYDGGTVIENLASGATLHKIADKDGSYYQVRSITSGKMGFVLKSKCHDESRTESETIAQQTIETQLFRIYEVSCDEESNTLTANARHISYDFANNGLYACKVTKATPNEAIANIQAALIIDDDRKIACNITRLDHSSNATTESKRDAQRISKDWSFKNPVNALLDPDSGLVKALNAKLIRNNADFFILDAASPRTGITIEYGVNMLGVTWNRSIENVITRVYPRSGSSDKGYIYITNGGKINNGAVQNQGKNYVESSIAGEYVIPHVEILNCSYQVGQEYEKPDGTKAKYTEETVREKMLEDAKKRFTEDVVDGVDVTLEVEFVLLGDTEEYRQYKGLQTVCLYDVVKVKTGKSQIETTAQVTEYEYNCLLERYNSVKLGKVNSFNRRVPGYRVVNSSITYEKLSPDLINRIITGDGSSSEDSGMGGGDQQRGIPNGSVDLPTVVDNSVMDDGIVKKGQGHANMVWATDANGNPAWRTLSELTAT